jgi:hypothetical protein
MIQEKDKNNIIAHIVILLFREFLFYIKSLFNLTNIIFFIFLIVFILIVFQESSVGAMVSRYLSNIFSADRSNLSNLSTATFIKFYGYLSTLSYCAGVILRRKNRLTNKPFFKKKIIIVFVLLFLSYSLVISCIYSDKEQNNPMLSFVVLIFFIFHFGVAIANIFVSFFVNKITEFLDNYLRTKIRFIQ